MISLSTSAPRKVSTRSILRQPTQAPKWCQCLSEPALSHPSRRKRQLQPFASTLVPPGPGAPMHVCDRLGGQPRWRRQGPSGPGANLYQPSLLLRPPRWGNAASFQMRMPRGGAERLSRRTASSTAFKISFWDCPLLGLRECYQTMGFFPLSDKRFYFFFHISHPRKSQGVGPRCPTLVFSKTYKAPCWHSSLSLATHPQIAGGTAAEGKEGLEISASVSPG